MAKQAPHDTHAQCYPTLCNPMDCMLEWIAFPFSRDLPNPGIEPRSPALQADSLPAEPQEKPYKWSQLHNHYSQNVGRERERAWGEGEPDRHHLGLFALSLLTKIYLDHSSYLVNLTCTVAFSWVYDPICNQRLRFLTTEDVQNNGINFRKFGQ